MESLLGKIDRNFFVAAFVPALAFATLSLFIFRPIIPPAILDQLNNTVAPLDHPALVLLMVTVVVAFSLYSLNIYIYKVMEGYFILNRIPAITRFQRRKALKSYVQIRALEKILAVLDESDEPPDSDQVNALKLLLFAKSTAYQFNYPISPKLIMPTRFGNALRAMEAYPNERYHMDAVLVWTRLIHVIPNSYLAKLDQSNNSLAFLINCSILSLGLAIMSGMAVGYQYLLWQLAQMNREQLLYFISINTQPQEIVKYQQNAYLYIIGTLIMMVLFVLFYRAALPIAVQYGNLVRSAFDLFRWNLFDALHLHRPKHYDDEIRIWGNLSMFIGHGWLNDETIPFRYGEEERSLAEAVENQENKNEEASSSSGLLEDSGESEEL